MEFVTFSTAFWEDKWVRKLPPLQKLLYAHLFTCSVNEYGFMEHDIELWAQKTGINRKTVAAGIERFVADGKVLCEKETLYMRNAIKHQRLAGNNLDGALKKVRANWADKAPRAVAECLKRYGNQTGSVRGSDPVPNQNITEQNTSQQSNVLLEEKIEVNPPVREPAPAGAGAQEGKPKASRKQKPEAQQWKLKAKFFADFIADKIELHNISHGDLDNTSEAAATALRLLVERDKVDLQEVREALEWAWEEHRLPSGDIYGSVLMSIARWREKNRAGELKIKACIVQFRNRRRGSAAHQPNTPQAVRL